MKTAFIIKIVALSIVVLLLLGVLITGMTGRLQIFRGINIPYVIFDDGGDDSRYTSGSASMNAKDISSIDIEWIEGAVNIVVADTDTIEFSEISSRELEEQYKMRYSVENGRLKIRYCKNNISYNLLRNLHKELTVTVPRGSVFDDFSLEAVSANINIGPVNTGNMGIEAVSGRLTITGATADRMTIEGVSGKTQINDVVSKDFTLTGVSGNVNIENCTIRKVSCELVSGGVFVQPGGAVQSVDISTVSGRIRLSLPENDGFTARYSVGSGSFQCDFPVNIENRTAVYKDGSKRFSISSISSSVRIEKE